AADSQLVREVGGPDLLRGGVLARRGVQEEGVGARQGGAQGARISNIRDDPLGARDAAGGVAGDGADGGARCQQSGNEVGADRAGGSEDGDEGGGGHEGSPVERCESSGGDGWGDSGDHGRNPAPAPGGEQGERERDQHQCNFAEEGGGEADLAGRSRGTRSVPIVPVAPRTVMRGEVVMRVLLSRDVRAREVTGGAIQATMAGILRRPPVGSRESASAISTSATSPRKAVVKLTSPAAPTDPIAMPARAARPTAPPSCWAA